MIFNLSSRMGFVQRSSGQSALAGSAYNSREKLYDERLGETFDYSRKKDEEVVSWILAPENAPLWVFDRQTLWNKAEAAEKRRDSQSAQRMMFSLPNEFSKDDCLDVVKEFCLTHFVSQGQIVDFAIHADPHNKHFHLQTTLRHFSAEGFHLNKPKEWTRREMAQKYRSSLAELCNEKLKELNVEKYVEHLSFADQGIDRTPTIHLGKVLHAQIRENQDFYQRIEEYREIIDRNYENVLSDPETYFFAELHKKNYAFTEDQILHQAALVSRSPQDATELWDFLKSHPSLITLGKDHNDRTLYALLSEIEKEKEFFHKADRLLEESKHKINVPTKDIESLVRKHTLTDGQKRALLSVLEGGDLKLLHGYAGVGKTTALLAIKEACEKQHWDVQGAAPINLAVDAMNQSGLPSRTLNRLMDDILKGERFSSKTVLIVDEASLIDDTKLEALVNMATEMKFKLVLMGDMEQLPSVAHKNDWIRALFEKYPSVLLDEVCRHNGKDASWQNIATRLFGESKTYEALRLYQDYQAFQESETEIQAQAAIIQGWAKDVQSFGVKEVLMLASTNVLVNELNVQARQHLRSQNLIGREQISIRVASHKAYKNQRSLSSWSILSDQMLDSLKKAVSFINNRPVSQKDISISIGDRIIFTDNHRDLGLLKGMRATVLSVSNEGMSVHVDSQESRNPVKPSIFKRLWDSVFGGSSLQAKAMKKVERSFKFSDMNCFDHAYALTIHKAQGQTVEATRFLASRYANAHLSYVSMSRHRKSCHVHYSKESFRNNSFLEKMASQYRNLSISAFGMRHRVDLEKELSQHKAIQDRLVEERRQSQDQKILQQQKERAIMAHREQYNGRS